MLYFDQVQLLGYKHTPEILDAGLKFRIKKTLSVKGLLYKQNSIEHARHILTKQNEILAAANDYDDIYLNGIFFGRGKILSVDFENGTLVRTEKYSYEIECYEEGDLSNAGSLYNGINWADSKLWDSLSESLSYEEDEDGNGTYNHEFSIRIAQQTSAATAIAAAKTVANLFFLATSGLGGFLGDYANNSKKFYTETYDIVSGQCSFSETVIINKTKVGNYSYSLSYSLGFDEKGYATIEETVSITGNNHPKMSGAEEGYNALVAAAYTRTNSVYTSYGISNATLYSQALTKSVSRNQFEGSIEFSHTFTNNPSYQDFAIWEFSLNFNKNEFGINSIAENGSIIGFWRPIKGKWANASTFYNSVKTGSAARVASFISRSTDSYGTLFLTNSSFERNEIAGTISYTFEYTDDPLYDVSSPFKKIEHQISLANPVHLIAKYNVFNLAELVQTQKQSSLGQKTITVSILGKRGTSITSYIVEAKSQILSLAPSETDTFLADCEYSFAPLENSFSMTAVYNFAGSYKTRQDLTIT